MYKLDDRLENDTFHVTDLALCDVLLMNDTQFPWLILVPRVEGITEIIDLSQTQQLQLWEESALISRVLRNTFVPDKLNVAALGNVVSQLHVHHVVRMKTDCAWPAPIWGRQPTVAYTQEAAQSLITQIQKQIQKELS